MEVPYYTIGDFLRDMGRPLQYREPTAMHNLWVFWSQEEGEGGGDPGPVTQTLTNNNWGNVQDYLKYRLCNAEIFSWAGADLIQFWAPTTTISGTIGVLKTSNQPFALYGRNGFKRGFCEYRKYCTSLEFNILRDEEDNEEEFGSAIERVFRHKKAEYKYNLPGDFAHKYGIRGSYFLPLFKPPSRCCSGVLELVHYSVTMFFREFPQAVVRSIFKEANFIYPSPLHLLESTEIEEINKALQGVCTTHQLPLAQIWIPCCTSTAMASVDSPGECCHSPYLSCSYKFSSSITLNGDPYFRSNMVDFNDMCRDHDFRTGQGIVGRALLYQKPCFCRDVTLLPIAEYPFSDEAGLSALNGCCAIWLHSTRTKNHYVLEFFLPHWITVSGDPQRYSELLLATVKKQLPGFKISSVGEESCVEVCEISVNDDKPDSVRISQTFIVKFVPESFANEKEMEQNEVVGETVIDSGSNILGLEQNGIVVCHSEKTAGEESDDDPTMEEAVRKNEPNVAIVKQTSEAVTFSERIFGRAEASEREYKTTNISLSREDLIKHFGKKLDDAAQILNVSRSTMKRALRHHKIDKWPLPKRKKDNVRCVCSANDGIEGTYKGDPSCSDPPPTPATAGISHKTSNSRQEQDVGTVTVKATHGGDTIRFDLPYLSRKSDLVEKVTTRLRLNEGSFNIKYQDEDNDWILIACDEDLDHCIGIWKGNRKIKMLVQPITNQAP